MRLTEFKSAVPGGPSRIDDRGIVHQNVEPLETRSDAGHRSFDGRRLYQIELKKLHVKILLAELGGGFLAGGGIARAKQHGHAVLAS